MITNGLSQVALRRDAKALAPPRPALFVLGTLENRFSARSRQRRLARLLIDSRIRFGFGVNETTALLAGKSANRWQLRTRRRR